MLGSENVDMDLMLDVLDRYNSAREKIHEFDPEMEAFISAHIGRIYYQGLSNSEKAKKYYRDSLRLLETLKPKTFNEQPWHQTMMKHMDEINKADLIAKDKKTSKKENKLRKLCKTEIDELWDVAGP